MTRSLSILALSGDELWSFVQKHATRNPALRLHARETLALDTETIGAARPSLHERMEHVFQSALQTTSQHRIGTALLGLLQPTGWLHEPLDSVAADLRVPVSDVEHVLGLLQQSAPAGVFCRSLAECLRLQLVRSGDLSPQLERLLEHLALLGDGKLTALANAIGCDEAELPALVSSIQALDPKPGLQFETAPIPPRPSDIVARPDGPGWKVWLQDDALPRVEVDLDARTEPHLVREAREIVAALARRAETSLRVAKSLIERQTPFVADDTAPRRPLGLVDLAEALELHPSTISRAIQARTLDAPRGRIKLKDLLCKHAPNGSVGQSADDAIRAIDTLISSEPLHAPLTDAEIVKLLDRRGLGMARRTVAKYRRKLGIASCYSRARQALP